MKTTLLLTLSGLFFVPLNLQNQALAATTTPAQQEALQKAKDELTTAKKKFKEEKKRIAAEQKKQRQEAADLRKEKRKIDNAPVPIAKLEKVSDKQDELEDLIDKEKKELAELEALKGKECTDASKPCTWDDVIDATKADISDLEAKASAAATTETEICNLASQRLNARDSRWSGIMNSLQPAIKQIEVSKNAIEALKRQRKDTDKAFKDNYSAAIKQAEANLEKAKQAARQQYRSLAGPAKAYVPTIAQAKLKLARTKNKMGRVSSLCADVNQKEPSDAGAPDPTLAEQTCTKIGVVDSATGTVTNQDCSNSTNNTNSTRTPSSVSGNTGVQ